MDEREQGIAERVEVLSRMLRGMTDTQSDLLPPMIQLLDIHITVIMHVMQDRYEAAGSPYGTGGDALWRWWNEQGRR